MKKFYSLLVLILLTAGSAHAFIETDDFTTENFTKNEGYSGEIYRLIHVTTKPEQARQEAEDYKKNHKIKYYAKKVYKYFDPYMDSGDFGRDDIKYYPSWDEI